MDGCFNCLCGTFDTVDVDKHRDKCIRFYYLAAVTG